MGGGGGWGGGVARVARRGGGGGGGGGEMSAEPGETRRDAGNSKGSRSRSPSPRVIAAEDNEAVIKIIAKGRTPALRHLHRTHRIEVDWLVEVFANEGMLLKHVPATLRIAAMFSKRFTEPLHWERLVKFAQIGRFKLLITFQGYWQPRRS